MGLSSGWCNAYGVDLHAVRVLAEALDEAEGGTLVSVELGDGGNLVL